MQNTSQYKDTVVRQFTIMTVVWGVVGMLLTGVGAWQFSSRMQRNRVPRSAGILIIALGVLTLALPLKTALLLGPGGHNHQLTTTGNHSALERIQIQ